MLKKENRLTKKKDFELIFNKGKTFFSNLIIIKTIPNNLKINRYGIIVGKKVSKKAVIRNLIKRRIREIINNNLLNITNNKDIIIISLAPIKNSSYDAINKALFFCFNKIK